MLLFFLQKTIFFCQLSLAFLNWGDLNSVDFYNSLKYIVAIFCRLNLGKASTPKNAKVLHILHTKIVRLEPRGLQRKKVV